MSKIGKINSIQTMGLLDGPGVRSVFFLQGCPIRCIYCHNPDTQQVEGGIEMTVEEIVDFAKRYENYYGEDGGITFSGGEPLLQGEFLAEALQALKKEGFHTVVDTSGYGDRRYFKEILEYTDHVLLDIKGYDKNQYREIVGTSDDPVQYFIKLLSEFDVTVTIRHVMITDMNDDKNSMDRLIRYIDPIIEKVDKIDILPFHQMGADKYEELGLEYKLEDHLAMDRRRARGFEFYVNEVLEKRKSQEGVKYQTFSPEARFKFTRNNQLFQHMDDDTIKEFVDQIAYRVMERGEKIFQSHDPADKFFIIVSGKIKVYEYNLDGKEQIYYIYSSGEYIGGHNVLKDTNYLYNGECIKPGVIGIIDKDFFNNYLIKHPEVLLSILEMSFQRIRLAEGLVQRLTASTSEEKVANLLLELIPLFGEVEDNKVIINSSMNREELASMIGVTRETLTRRLLEYQKEELIELKGNQQIIIKNITGLREAAQVVVEVPD